MDEATTALALIWLLSFYFPALVCSVAFAVGVAVRIRGKPGSRTARIGMLVMALAVIGFVGWAGGITASSTIKNVDDGHVAIVYQGGGIIGLKGDGIQLIAPWQEIQTESIRAQQHTFTNVSSFSAEGLEVFASVTVDYRVDREAVLPLYEQVGPSWFDILIEPRINHYMTAAVVRYEADEVMANSEEIAGRLRDALVADLEEFGIAVEGLEVGDWNVTRR